MEDYNEFELQSALEHKELFPKDIVGVTIHEKGYMSFFVIGEDGEFIVNSKSLKEWKDGK